MRLQFYSDGPNRGVQSVCRAWEVWLYAGRSFNLDDRVQRQRISRDCGYVQFAYGQVRHFGLMARRTLGLQIAGRLTS